MCSLIATLNKLVKSFFEIFTVTWEIYKRCLVSFIGLVCKNVSKEGFWNETKLKTHCSNLPFQGAQQMWSCHSSNIYLEDEMKEVEVKETNIELSCNHRYNFIWKFLIVIK